MKKIAIIGGGASGMTASLFLPREDSVTVFEKNSRCGRKLGITGKGRCNLTNIASPREMLPFIPRGGKFLLSALNGFSSDDTAAFFESLGVPLKTERGGRVFPVSDRASDIVSALTGEMAKRENIKTVYKAVTAVKKTGDGFEVSFSGGKALFDRVIIATGGKSYPATGSTGDGYAFARALGHTVIKPKASLVPVKTSEDLVSRISGLSLKNIGITVTDENGKTVYTDFGEMLFCHFGVSGPVILSASAYLDFEKSKVYRLYIDLKPALDRETLDKRLLRDFSENINRDFKNSLSALLPKGLVPEVVAISGISPEKKVNLITREERQKLASVLKAFPLTLTCLCPVEEAIITSGGVSLKEIDPRTMRSKIVPGLYFAGEVMDADALTGGFNLQIAFSTAVAAARGIMSEE